MTTTKNNKLTSSWRDPSGFLFTRDSKLYRQINVVYKNDYDLLTESGLYKKLVTDKVLISHQAVNIEPEEEGAYKIIEPTKLDFISYPYEWSFSQFKDAALTTLKIQKQALEFGMTLKDSSAYNIQWHQGRPVLIDTLSFAKYREGDPWVAYKQFCQHFLAPLALMVYQDIRLNQLLRIYIDGIPLDLASKLLPGKSRLKFSLLSHIHLHAKSQQYFADKKVKSSKHKMSKFSLLSLINSLESTIQSLKWEAKGTEWGDYYSFTNYTKDTFKEKKDIIADWLKQVQPKNVWDVGANTGEFSRIASGMDIPTISFDIDPAAIEKNYLEMVKRQEVNILPLVIDLANPSSNIGWANQERMSLIERGPTDMAWALALVHHLAISNNLPFDRIAEFFSQICQSLIIEFVPKSDSQVQKLLASREDIFPNYTEENFVKHFKLYFPSVESKKIEGSERILYLMTKQ